MGFLFEKEKAKQASGSKPSVKRVDDSSKGRLYKMGCEACPLNDADVCSPKMPPDGEKDAVFYFLGDAPTVDDDKKGRHFSGKAGNLLRLQIPPKYDESVRFNYVIRDRKEGGKDPDPVEIACCRGYIERDIEETKPRVIIGVGDIPLQWATGLSPGKAQIKQWRGRHMPVKIGNHTCWFFPVQHPASLLRNRKEFRGKVKKSEEELVWERDLDRVFAEAKTLPEPPYETEEVRYQNITVIDGKRGDRDVQRIEKALERIRQQPHSAIDIETTTLKPYATKAKICTVAIGTGNDTVSFPLDHRESPWTKEQRKQVRKALKAYLRDPDHDKIAHNTNFELEWLGYHFGYDLLRACTWHDTMAQAFCLDERKGVLGLDALTVLHMGFDVKAVSTVDTKKIDQEPLSAVLWYNGLDTKYEHRVYEAQVPILENLGLRSVYYEQIRRIPTLVLTQAAGMVRNLEAVKRLRSQFEEQLDGILKEIANNKDVKRFSKKRNKEYNPGSHPDNYAFFHDFLGFQQTHFNKDVLPEIDHPVAQQLAKYREIQNLISTYLTPMDDAGSIVYPDGKLHGTFKGCHAETRRLCIRKGTHVSTLTDLSVNPKGTRIEDVRVGDLVYTYDENTNLTVRPVKWVGCTGHKNLVRVYWTRKGSGAVGYTDCTPDHRIRTFDGSYKQAQHLKAGEHLLALNREVNDRSKLWGKGVHRVREERFLGAQFHHLDIENTSLHCHHVDGNPLNNVPENIQVLRDTEHASLHAKQMWSDPVRRSNGIYWLNEARKKRVYSAGESAWIRSLSKVSLLRLLVLTGCRVTYINGFDYSTIRNRLEAYGIDVSEVRKRFSDSGKFITRGEFAESVRSTPGKTKARYKLNIDYYQFHDLAAYYGVRLKNQRVSRLREVQSKFTVLRKIREAKGQLSKVPYDFDAFKRKALKFGVDASATASEVRKRMQYYQNHEVLCVKWLGEKDYVYDLEVEGTHNFIANEICVHNSSEDPNLQNFPKRDHPEVREVVRAPDGYMMLSVDYGGLEACVIAMATQDDYLVRSMWDRYDIHMEWAHIIEEEYPGFIERSGSEKDARQNAKGGIVFPAFYGAQPPKIAQSLGIPQKPCDRLLERFWATFPGVKEWQQDMFRFYRKHGYVELLTGWRRRGPLDPNKIINCVDTKTECLTKEGWKTVDQLRVGEEIYTKNPTTGDLELNPIRLVHRAPFKGYAYKLDGTISALTTPDHRWLVDRKATRTRAVRTEFIESQNLAAHKGSDHRIHLTANAQAFGGGVWSDDEVELIGWFLTDGCRHTIELKRENRVKPYFSVGQSPVGNPEKCDRIQNLVDRLDVPYRYRYQGGNAQKHWTFYHGIGERIAAEFPDKILTHEFLHSLSLNQLQILYDTMLLGDGTFDRYAVRYRHFVAGAKEKADMFSYLCVLLGVPHRIKSRQGYGYGGKGTKDGAFGKLYWTVHLKQHNRCHPGFCSSWEWYEGEMWCPNVENQTFIARREGTVYVTGNTPIQGSGSDIVVDAMNRLSEYAQRTNQWQFQPILNVHDDLTFYVPEESAEEDVDKIIGMMLDVPFDFVNVPVIVEPEAGYDWYNLEGLGKFYSDEWFDKSA